MYRREKRIPTLIALFIIFLGISGTVFIDRFTVNLSTSAKQNQLPKEVHVTDVSERSFIVSWFSDEPTVGSVNISNNAFSAIYLDDLDNDNVARPRISHYITVKNLSEDTLYNIKIISGSSKCKSKDECPTFIQKTPQRLPAFSSLPPVKGQAITKDNQPANGAIVYLMVGKSAPISSRIDSAGLWVIPFHNLRNQDLTDRPNLPDDEVVQITIRSSLKEEATAVIDLKSIRQNLTLPNMQLGNSYNFINLVSKKDLFAQKNYSQNILGVQTKITNPTPFLSTSKTNDKPPLDFIFPNQDGEPTTDTRPRFNGTGSKGSILNITVNSTPQQGQTTVGQDGIWVFRPNTPLAPGVHTITVQGLDENGKIISYARKFIVLKSGESVLGEATSSGNLTATPTPTVYTTPTSTPTIIASPTAITPSPTVSPSPAPTVFMPTATPTPLPPPPTGDLQPLILISIISTIIMFIGVKLFISI